MAWVGLEEEPVYVANHFISQFDDELFYLSFGLAVPPAFLGTLEERREAAELVEYVPVETLARISLTPASMKKLAGILQRSVEQYEAHEEYGDTEDEDLQ